MHWGFALLRWDKLGVGGMCHLALLSRMPRGRRAKRDANPSPEMARFGLANAPCEGLLTVGQADMQVSRRDARFWPHADVERNSHFYPHLQARADLTGFALLQTPALALLLLQPSPAQGAGSRWRSS